MQIAYMRMFVLALLVKLNDKNTKYENYESSLPANPTLHKTEILIVVVLTKQLTTKRSSVSATVKHRK